MIFSVSGAYINRTRSEWTMLQSKIMLMIPAQSVVYLIAMTCLNTLMGSKCFPIMQRTRFVENSFESQ